MIEGLIEQMSPDPAHLPGGFRERLTVTMRPRLREGRIHYTLDGRAPSRSSPVYESPLTLESTVTVEARLFDERGRAKGAPWKRTLSRVECVE